jgi:hypothetical protein
MPDYAFSVVQFRISRAVADAVHVDTLNERARAAGVADRLEYNAKDVRGGGYRITCGRAMAVFIIEEIKRLIAIAEGPLVLDCGEGVMAALKALEPPEKDRGVH